MSLASVELTEHFQRREIQIGSESRPEGDLPLSEGDGVTHIPARGRWKETKVERDDLFVSRRAERKGEVFRGDSNP